LTLSGLRGILELKMTLAFDFGMYFNLTGLRRPVSGGDLQTPSDTFLPSDFPGKAIMRNRSKNVQKNC
jgi:hypothetical protein